MLGQLVVFVCQTTLAKRHGLVGCLRVERRGLGQVLVDAVAASHVHIGQARHDRVHRLDEVVVDRRAVAVVVAALAVVGVRLLVLQHLEQARVVVDCARPVFGHEAVACRLVGIGHIEHGRLVGSIVGRLPHPLESERTILVGVLHLIVDEQVVRHLQMHLGHVEHRFAYAELTRLTQVKHGRVHVEIDRRLATDQLARVDFLVNETTHLVVLAQLEVHFAEYGLVGSGLFGRVVASPVSSVSSASSSSSLLLSAAVRATMLVALLVVKAKAQVVVIVVVIVVVFLLLLVFFCFFVASLLATAEKGLLGLHTRRTQTIAARHVAQVKVVDHLVHGEGRVEATRLAADARRRRAAAAAAAAAICNDALSARHRLLGCVLGLLLCWVVTTVARVVDANRCRDGCRTSRWYRYGGGELTRVAARERHHGWRVDGRVRGRVVALGLVDVRQVVDAGAVVVVVGVAGRGHGRLGAKTSTRRRRRREAESAQSLLLLLLLIVMQCVVGCVCGRADGEHLLAAATLREHGVLVLNAGEPLDLHELGLTGRQVEGAQAKALAHLAAHVGGEEESEALDAEVAVAVVAVAARRVYLRVGVQVADALDVDHDEAVIGALEREVAEGVRRVAQVRVLHISRIRLV